MDDAGGAGLIGADDPLTINSSPITQAGVTTNQDVSSVLSALGWAPYVAAGLLLFWLLKR